MQSIRLTLPISASDTKLVWPRARLRFVLFLVRIWLVYAFFLATLPVPVSLKRFFALEHVFIFGITFFYMFFTCLIIFYSHSLMLPLRTSAYLPILAIALLSQHPLMLEQISIIKFHLAPCIRWHVP